MIEIGSFAVLVFARQFFQAGRILPIVLDPIALAGLGYFSDFHLGSGGFEVRAEITPTKYHRQRQKHADNAAVCDNPKILKVLTAQNLAGQGHKILTAGTRNETPRLTVSDGKALLAMGTGEVGHIELF